MSYPGDTSLSGEIQERILSTFSEALTQADNGNREEALLGCDFILRLDPLFEPARALQRRLGDEGPISLDDLREIVLVATPDPDAAASGPADSSPDDDDVEILDLDEGLLVEDPAPAGPAPSLLEDLPVEPLDLGDTGIPEPEGSIAADPTGTAPGIASDSTDGLLADSPADSDSPDSDVMPLGEVPGGSEMSFAGVLEEVVDEEDSSSASGGDEAADRIADLLGEGQEAFDKKNFQDAIDAWSRIFLIDIDHEEANRRIEEARKLKAESERAMEEILHEGIAKQESGDTAGAREAFERILELQPNHLVARDHLNQLSAVKAEPGAADAAAAPAPMPIDPDAGADEVPEDEPEDDERVDAVAAEVEELLARRSAKKEPGRAFFFIGSAVLVLALLGGWYLFSNWDRMFPNSRIEEADGPAVDPIARAQQLQLSGNTTMAIAQLRRLPPDDPRFSEAQALIAQWETAAAELVETETELSPEEGLLVEQLETEARSAFAEERYLKASMVVDRIAEMTTPSNELIRLKADADQELEPLQRQIELIRQGDWEFALPQLWRMFEEDPSDADVVELLVSGYFNLGVRDLQRGRPQAASEKFAEALVLAPADEELLRLQTFAQTYQQKRQDLLYRIFVKYVPFR